MKTLRMSPKYIIIVLIVIAVAIPIIYSIMHAWLLRDDINHHSEMSTLNACIREDLQEYYKKQGRYPEKLQIIRETILKSYYPKGIPEPNMIDFLNEFKYSTDGNSYIIIWEVKYKHVETTYTHKEEGQNGDQPQSKMYINGKLFEGD